FMGDCQSRHRLLVFSVIELQLTQIATFLTLSFTMNSPLGEAKGMPLSERMARADSPFGGCGCALPKRPAHGDKLLFGFAGELRFGATGTMFDPRNIARDSLEPILEEMGRGEAGTPFNVFG